MTDAFAAMITSICQMVTAIVEGQPPEVKKQLWEWYVKDVEAWRKFWGVEK
jgi:hypothetical protein